MSIEDQNVTSQAGVEGVPGANTSASLEGTSTGQDSEPSEPGVKFTGADAEVLKVAESLMAAKSSIQQEFDQLVARKQELWGQISGMALYDFSSQWQEIEQIDKRLLALWNEGNSGVIRKEDK